MMVMIMIDSCYSEKDRGIVCILRCLVLLKFRQFTHLISFSVTQKVQVKLSMCLQSLVIIAEHFWFHLSKCLLLELMYV